jgi:hypothetical protein
VFFLQVMSEKARQNVISVRHFSHSYLFTDAKTGMADASVSIGTIYEGSDLKVSRPLCELSLKWKKDQLVKSVKEQVPHRLVIIHLYLTQLGLSVASRAGGGNIRPAKANFF